MKDTENNNEKSDTIFCEKANEEITKMLIEQTTKALNKVVYNASCMMKNSFSRSDA